MPPARPHLSAGQARALLMDAQCLLATPDRRATAASLARLVQRLGYVQLDSINVVDRGHHLTLAARLAGFQPRHLEHLLERRRDLFEHWTHDASAIPAEWFPHWKPRFRRFEKSVRAQHWVKRRMKGQDPKKLIAQVQRRIRREGPLMSRDFESARPEGSPPSGGFWAWTPEKTALEYLWRAGKVAITARRSFQKVYDLVDRVLPEVHRLRAPSQRAHVDWACSEAIERLGVGTSGEIAHFFEAISRKDASDWCRRAERTGRIVALTVGDDAGGRPRPAFAVADWEARLGRLQEPPEQIRLLSPFDPVIRDRKRLLRLFGFDYRFEAFVPAAKRQWGYYVLPMLEGDRFVGRVDPKIHRDRDTLAVQQVHWEPGVRPTRARRRSLEEAVTRLADRIGATSVEWPVAASQTPRPTRSPGVGRGKRSFAR